jgi:16S rRNA processing protein RimM
VPQSGYDPETLLVGVLGRPHGLRGEILLRPHNPAGSDLATVTELIIESDAGERERRAVERIRRAGEGWLIKLDGIGSRDEVEHLTNRAVRVQRRALPPPGSQEFFVEDTLGCHVTTEEGTDLGVVETVFWNGAQDVWVIRAGGRETLIPLVPAYVRRVDPGARQIVVAWSAEVEEIAPALAAAEPDQTDADEKK